MNYEELKEINFGKPSRKLLEKALLECEGIITFYREQLAKDKKPYWRGKIGHQCKQRLVILERIKENNDEK